VMAFTKSVEMDTLSPSPHIQNQVTLLDEQCERKAGDGSYIAEWIRERKENYFILLLK